MKHGSVMEQRAGSFSREGKSGAKHTNRTGRSSNLTIRNHWQVQVWIWATDGVQGQTQPSDDPAWPPRQGRSKLVPGSPAGGSESRSRLKSYKPKRRLAATQLWCSPSRGRWHTPSLKAVPKGKTGQGIASGFLTAALTGTEANLGLRQVDSLTQPTKLPKGGCAPGPVN